MNITKKGLPWTEKDDDYLKGAYHVFSIKQIAEDLGRTPGAVSQRAIKLNITQRPNYWTKEEKAYLEREYQLGTDIEKMEKFLQRDRRLITSKAVGLGLRRPVAWLDCEDEFLLSEREKKVPYKDIAEKLNKTLGTCYSRFHYLKKQKELSKK